MKKIVLTGGGTAGHIMPNIALIPYLRQNFEKIYYIGTKNGLEERLLSEFEDVTFLSIDAVKFIRKLTIKNLLIPFKLIKSICKCKKILKTINPDIIFSKGGYVSISPVIAAHSLKIPVISHESDLTMGLANKIIYKFCTKMCTAFEQTSIGKKKCVYTGLPIRRELLNGNKIKLKLLCKFDDKPVILFMGGSLGAKKINEILTNSINELTKKYNILHITGRNNKTKIKNNSYYQVEFTNNIEDFFSLSDYVVSRSGANTIFELMALKKPMLLIPLPKDESRGDQIKNAEYLLKKNLAHIIYQDKLTPESLLEEIKKLKKDAKNLRYNLSKIKSLNSADKIINLTIKTLNETNKKDKNKVL